MRSKFFQRRSLRLRGAILSLLTVFIFGAVLFSSCSDDRDTLVNIDIFSDTGQAPMKAEYSYRTASDEPFTRYQDVYHLEGNTHKGRIINVQAYCINANDREKVTVTIEIRVNGKLRNRGVGIGATSASVKL